MKQKIIKDIRNAILSNDIVARTVLRVLLGEIERYEQTPKGKIKLSENEIIKITKKLTENIRDSYTDPKCKRCIDELYPLQKYLPKKLTQYQIEEIIDTFIVDNEIDNMKGMGKIMNHFAQNFPNRYDGKNVSILIREVLI